MRGTKPSYIKRFPYHHRCKLLLPQFSIIFIFLFLLCSLSPAQKSPEKNWNSSRILHELEKMKHLGRVLYIAAHPDDENTSLISYLANVKGLETAYLSLTRGDGGQDLLGPEVREELGVIRTQELLMARSVDGGEQFFTRANDFGFSKTAAETFHIWDSNEVLSDVVWVIRNFKPDIIITRFSPSYTKTHGHHTASAILAREAFDDAANPNKFPEQLKYVQPWQATSIFWNTNLFFFQGNNFDTSGLYHTNIGIYMPLLGKSVGEMAAESRSMHKSQGMGTSLRRGDNIEYFVYLSGKMPGNKDIFSVDDFSWNRINGMEDVSTSIDKIITEYALVNPQDCLDELIPLYSRLYRVQNTNYLIPSKIEQLGEIILQCKGIYTEALCNKKLVSPGDSLTITLNCFKPDTSIQGNPYSENIEFADMEKRLFPFPNGGKLKDGLLKFENNVKVPEDAHITGPYWLEEEPNVGMYKVDNQLLRGKPQNSNELFINIYYGFSSKKTFISIPKVLPVFSKKVDPIKGEVYSLVHIVPPAVANTDSKLLIFTGNQSKVLNIKIKTFSKGKATVKLMAPSGWIITPPSQDIDMKGDETEIPLAFSINPPDNAQTSDIEISIEAGGNTYNRSIEDINYDHIPEQILLPKSKVRVVKMDIKTTDKFIGYITGAGDDIPDLLKELGYKVEIIPSDQLASTDFSKYDAIITGVRAYNTVERLKYDNPRLLEYVKNGGNFIVQYNTLQGLVTKNIGPYPMNISSNRVTEEDCKVTFLNKDNPVFNTPNKITQDDFNNWVQERGLYFPDKWDTAHYIPLLEMADKGEKPMDGALLVAKYGKGNFVYIGLSFFRELPAGVTGAYRLYVNLIEIPKNP